MAETRRVRQALESRATTEGAGVRLHRAIGFGAPGRFDPFLLLDDFRSDDPADYAPGFPWHPHRGMETITYLLRGEVEHADSLGHRGVIGPGDVQWMTAGRGIIHQEMPRGDAHGSVHGFQLWANLPRAHKMAPPRYRGFTAREIPEVVAPGGATVRVIAGSVGSVRGPVRDVVSDPEYLDVSLPPHSAFGHPTPTGHTVFAYVIGGRGAFGAADAPRSSAAKPGHDVPSGESLVGDRHLVQFSDGDAVSVRTESDPVRFLLVSGRPIGEPIAWRGPIVMNTQEELREAFDALDRGTFLEGA